MKKTILSRAILTTALAGSLLLSGAVSATDYVIDTKGAHASIDFKVSHLGYSFVVGRFNDFEGDFSFDGKKLADGHVNVTIKTASLDSNHAERDKHLRSPDFLNTAKFPEASFKSSSIVDKGEGNFLLNGDFTLNGVTKPITIQAKAIGEGQDPWGGYRAGFTGTTEFALKDYNIKMDLGPASSHVQLAIVVEGIRL
ncbi:YceI family protein [Shewanella psychropiezotolerans]|uniref:YceI family protein n=1 Tax=Shewanella psychropiezotolerans TaxID=2593655 RepID=A0ABX5X1V0_9GAMM|nr:MULTISPECIES: YceI family protein [Shewanella]MPY21011.1 YceI family protein [Shewanella sp. YLB-07]MPY21798.1 YceI family protein [Shewanella sp. YLB-07]QDO85310.1 YceI family protein [Shewanella psychropiezotolerans]